MKSLIYGYGITGQSFARYLKNLDINYDIFDNNIPQYNKLSNLENYEAIYCSPGVPKKNISKIKICKQSFNRFGYFSRER